MYQHICILSTGAPAAGQRGHIQGQFSQRILEI
jgi:hypothetical protein